MIHSAAQVNHPIEQGITWLALGCGAPGNVLAINAFASIWEPLRYMVVLCLLLFSSAILMSQWYFGFVALPSQVSKVAREYFARECP